LTHSPQDYMEDHMNACRLAVSATFVRAMPNFKTLPARRVFVGNVTVYHAMPHGMRDGLGRLVLPQAFVDTASVHPVKRRALAAHRSQMEWLDLSQSMDSYLDAMDQMSIALGKKSKRFRHAEGWRRHSHLGFCPEQTDPLKEELGRLVWMAPNYQAELQ
jgi:LmbE family N-acetylglucosaminyl deacetylase